MARPERGVRERGAPTPALPADLRRHLDLLLAPDPRVRGGRAARRRAGGYRLPGQRGGPRPGTGPPSPLRPGPAAVGLALLIALAGTLLSLAAPRAAAPPVAALVAPSPEAVRAAAVAGPLFVDPASPAAQQVTAWKEEGRAEEAAALRQIAEQPVALWLTDAEDVTARVADHVDRAEEAGAVPLLVTDFLPGRRCDDPDGGGAADAAEYRAWTGRVASGLAGRRAIVVVEPGAIPEQLSGCAGRGADARYALLAGAVDVLTAAGAAVYLDAGHPGFVPDLLGTADALERSGVRAAAGFGLNVGSFYSTEASVAHGTALSEVLGGGVRFVVDTGRNGRGRPPENADGDPRWCNPAGRRIGTPPTLDPGIPLVDALLWVKPPGESDGDCDAGDPAAGAFFPEYALELVGAG